MPHDEWRVAMVVPLRGPAGLFAPSCEAVIELAVDEVNASQEGANSPAGPRNGTTIATRHSSCGIRPPEVEGRQERPEPLWSHHLGISQQSAMTRRRWAGWRRRTTR